MVRGDRARLCSSCQAGQAGTGDIGNAIEGLIAVCEYVNGERPAP